MNALLVASLAALQPRLALRPLRPLAVTMCDAPEEITVESLQAQIPSLEAQIEKLAEERVMVPDGPNRQQILSELSGAMGKLEEDLAVAKARLEAKVGPPPKRYSAVGRMRQKTEGMGMDQAEGEEGGFKPLPAESFLPPMSGLVNIGITIAVVVAATAALSG